MADDTLDLEGAGRPIAGRRRFSNASPTDQRLFLKAFMDENLQTWKDSEGNVYKINRRGDIKSSFAGSTEIVSRASRSQKLKAGRIAARDKNFAIKTNATKRAAGETKAQRLTAQQEQLFATSDVAETDEQIQKRVQKNIDGQRKGKNGTLKSYIGLGMGIGFGGSGLGASLDDIYGAKMAESGGRGSGGGRMIGRPRKAL